jgi:Rrf2 family protein
MLGRKTAAYALLAIYEIARQQRTSEDLGVRAHDISQKHHLPKAYVAKILSQLAGAGVLQSDRGPRGGFRLSRPDEKILLFDVFDAVGALKQGRSKGPAVKGLPPAVQAMLDRANGDMTRLFRESFSKITVADLLRRGNDE